MNLYTGNKLLYLLTFLSYSFMRLTIGDIFFLFRIDFAIILFINILSTILINYTNINKYYILLFQSISLLITPIFNHIYGYWRRPLENVNLAKCNFGDLDCVIEEFTRKKKINI